MSEPGSESSTGALRRKALAGLIGLIIVVGTLAALWRFTPLSQLAEPERVAELLGQYVDSPWAPATVLVIYLVGNALLFPTIVLNMTMILTLGAGWGFVYAMYGSMAAGLAGYLLGRLFGRKPLQKLEIRRLERSIDMLRKSGVVGLAVLRLVPIAPYPVVNAVLGAAGIGLVVYSIGTFLGLLPSVLAMTAVGHQLRALIENPDPLRIALLVLVTLTCLAALWFIQRLARQKLATAG
ncbi:MAG: VTT domain-containing protein [Pseudomonadota bacterium]|nr:VTT domain-containing protein [Pseudomonadota bacterium]